MTGVPILERLGSYESYIIRYRPAFDSRAQLIIRTHDLAGTDYQHVRYLSPDEVGHYVSSRQASFLYGDEATEYTAKIVAT